MTESDKQIATLQAQMDEQQRKTRGIPEDCTSHTEILKSINEKVDKLSDSLTWIWRTIIGGIITIIVGFIIYFGTHPNLPQNQKTGANNYDNNSISRNSDTSR